MGRALAHSSDRQWRVRGKAREIAAPEGEKATQAGWEEIAASDRAERPNDTLIHISTAVSFADIERRQNLHVGKKIVIRQAE